MKLRSALAAIVAVALLGCSATQRPPGPNDGAQASRLARIFADRTGRGQVGRDYEIAPGDRIQIAVPNADELNGEFTVGRDGIVSLPLLGDMNVSGMTEKDLAEKLRSQLAAQYLQSPEVIVSVTSHEGRRVSVTGSVAKPGVYKLKRSRDTILDMLTQAGGIASDAGSTIYFYPGGDAAPALERAVLASDPARDVPRATGQGDRKPIEIDLTKLYQGKPLPVLNLPVRNGDVIFVQPGGQVVVDGWVGKPSPYPMQRAMTVTQAVSKAGGLHFAASPSSVTLSRAAGTGSLHSYAVDYGAIEGGKEKDIYLQPGDRLYVSANPLKAGVWGVYKVISGVVRIGFSAALAIF